MERGEWMNDQVREEIAELQQLYGFEEEEAIALWHLSEAHSLMASLLLADRDEMDQVREREYDAEGLNEGQRAGRDIGATVNFAAEVEARVV